MKNVPWREIVVSLILLGIFVTNTAHEEYPDEYDSIVGGRYILEGKVPYAEWFQHHQPFAYIVAAGILSITGMSFVAFRIVLSIVYWSISIGGYWYIRRRFGMRKTAFYLPTLLFVACISTYYWGQMLLADVLSAYLLIPLLAMLYIRFAYTSTYRKSDIVFISLGSFLIWFTSMTYTPVIMLIALVVLFHIPKNREYISWYFLVFALPYSIFLLYLLVSGSFSEYYFATVEYNQKYYIYNIKSSPGEAVHPIRYATVLFRNFYIHFYGVLSQILSFRFDNPLKVTFAVGNAFFIGHWVLRKRWWYAIWTLAVLVFVTARSNPDSLKETDYQALPYIYLSIITCFFTIQLFYRKLSYKRLSISLKSFYLVGLWVLGIYIVFSSLFVPLKFTERFHRKFMGEEPLIYNRPQIAHIVNSISDSDDYVWVGPFEFKELMYIDSDVPSKYHWFLQHAKHSQKIQSELLNQFNENRALVIVFDREYVPWGGDARTYNYFFTEFLDAHYFRISGNYETFDHVPYRWNIADTRNFELDTHFHFLKDREEDILSRLLHHEYIIPTE